VKVSLLRKKLYFLPAATSYKRHRQKTLETIALFRAIWASHAELSDGRMCFIAVTLKALLRKILIPGLKLHVKVKDKITLQNQL